MNRTIEFREYLCELMNENREIQTYIDENYSAIDKLTMIEEDFIQVTERNTHNNVVNISIEKIKYIREIRK